MKSDLIVQKAKKVVSDLSLSYKIEDVKNWMIEKQLGQRNLTKEQKDYLIGKRYENEKQRHGGARDQNDPL